METMFVTTLLTIVWGLLIGILVSAPMGPTGILVIQRTLNKGWLPGLLTGLGAVLSDLFYAVISGFGIAFIVDWIQHYQVTLQFLGSLFIVAYGGYLWFSNPASALATSDSLTSANPRRLRGWAKFFFTGFGLTISNPAIVFFYLALFARTNFLFAADREHWWIYLLGFSCIMAGAISWWLLITWLINKVRNHFKLHTLKIINRSIAALMFGIAVVGFASGIYQLVTR
jgi:threonine/homoserine/homoserine lactone efflux protein